ncbi:MAG TPA: TAXI family TRAP transporter solute-binding subunit [Thermoanaerobaculia bacterium]|nr:TAXI family TRAP transporter solute-binding subunit [Thermoanaerobaculia bacterium]
MARPDLPERRPARIALAAALFAAAVLAAWGVVALLHPLPPRHLVMTTGPEGGAYRELGEKYRAFLAREGIEVKLLVSAGNVENLKRLKDPASGVAAGFAAGGLTTAAESPEIVSLGTISDDPVWIFCRGLPEPVQLADFRGKRVSIGPEGGGTRALMLELLRANGMEEAITPLPLSPGAGGEALLRGEIDCACMLTASDAPIVKRLLADESVSLVSFPRADAYVALYPYLRKLHVPMGVGNLATNRPPHDVTLVGPMSSLLVRADLHPALQLLLLEAAEEIHSGPGVFRKPGQFPAAEAVDVPLAPQARHFYRSGQSFLQRHLPFWLWVVVTQLLFILIPLVGVLYPALRIAPAAYHWAVQRRIVRLYGELRMLEDRLEIHPAGERVVDLLAALDRLEEKVSHVRVPASHANSLYTLRHHLTLVRERLRKRSSD